MNLIELAAVRMRSRKPRGGMPGTLRNVLRIIYQVLIGWHDGARGVLWSRDTPIAPGELGIDIGCGPRKGKGLIGVDQLCMDGVDVVCNLEIAQLPFYDETCDVVYANHVLEHIANLNGLLAEVSRVLKPGGKFRITIPYAGDLRAFQDPTHVRFFTIKTFEYFVKEGSRVGGWYQTKHFKRISRRHLIFGRGPISLILAIVVNCHQSLLDFYEASALRVISARDLQVELEK